MKTTIAIILILISVNCFGQTNGTNENLTNTSTNSKLDLTKTKIVMPPDSIAIVSLRDYDTFYKFLQDNVVKSKYDKLTPLEVLEFFHQWAVFEYNRKKKK